MILNTHIRSSKHNHGLVLLYANNDWICEICKSNKQKTESKYHCSLCDFNICKNCIESNSKYPLNSYDHKQLYLKKYKFPQHRHELLFCRSSRYNHESEPFRFGLAKVVKDGKMMYIDHDGIIVWEEK